MTTPMPDLLVRDEPAGRTRERAGTALCLSGGGYRAMVFHAGVLAQQKAVVLGQFTNFKLAPHDKGYKLQSVVDWLRTQDMMGENAPRK